MRIHIRYYQIRLTSEMMAHTNELEDAYDEPAVISSGGKKKLTNQHYFPSNICDKYICNAETGVLYPFKVGSKESRILFRVVDTTGTCNSAGIPCKEINYNPNHMYYDTPEQFMRHQRMVVAKETVVRWREKRLEL